MKISIVTITYDKDLEFLKYNLKLIKKFCRGYHENVVVIDDNGNDCKKTQEYLESIGQKYYINREAKKIQKGYIRQQYMGYYMDKYLDIDTDYVCCLDSDNIFTSHHNPSVYFKNNLPIMGMTKWKDMPNTLFKQSTEQVLGYESTYNFMRRMPFIYPVWVFAKIRDYIETLHSRTLEEYFRDIEICAEYCIWGDYLYKFFREHFYWVDTHQNKKEWDELNLKFPCTQYSNRRYAQPHRYVDLSDPSNVIAKLL
jgi:hypothetical protein